MPNSVWVAKLGPEYHPSYYNWADVPAGKMGKFSKFDTQISLNTKMAIRSRLVGSNMASVRLIRQLGSNLVLEYDSRFSDGGRA